mmetsp:Transcript_123938/g.396183  ORF Transcript_123938/g.396183 Transcript_123938/m.396183 type:complete len:407 (+) Transcript_123938:412-1632(+)
MGPKSSRHSGARIRSCLTERIAAGGAAGALGGAAAAPSAAGAAGAGERSGAKASASAAASWASASGISQEKIRAVPAAAASVGKVTSNMSTPNSTACSTSTGEPEFRGRNRGSRKGSAEHTASNTLARECRSSVYPKPPIQKPETGIADAAWHALTLKLTSPHPWMPARTCQSKDDRSLSLALASKMSFSHSPALVTARVMRRWPLVSSGTSSAGAATRSKRITFCSSSSSLGPTFRRPPLVSTLQTASPPCTEALSRGLRKEPYDKCPCKCGQKPRQPSLLFGHCATESVRIRRSPTGSWLICGASKTAFMASGRRCSGKPRAVSTVKPGVGTPSSSPTRGPAEGSASAASSGAKSLKMGVVTAPTAAPASASTLASGVASGMASTAGAPRLRADDTTSGGAALT